MALVLAMEEGSGVTITANPDVENVRDGGDGGERAPRLPYIPRLVRLTAPMNRNADPTGWIYARRQAHGLTRSELALKLGVHPATVKAWECGASVPQQRNMVRLLDSLQWHDGKERLSASGLHSN